MTHFQHHNFALVLLLLLRLREPMHKRPQDR